MHELSPEPIHQDPLFVVNDEGLVLILSPTGGAIPLTAEAAERTADRLWRAAAAARVADELEGSGLLLRH
ncbi:hypothetical protein [Phenylobacterium sp.]|uniref:hypothetical protein n=1 Tax=Phenylobacterium sp. TaxID=1871053 RepID=UPI0035B49AF2